MSAAAAIRDPSARDELSPANFRRLAELIQTYSGIRIPPGKRTMLEGRLRRRLRVVDCATLDDYCRHLFVDGGLEAEVIHLIDAVTTNKTEFFREPAHFQLLRSKILPALAETGRRKIKVWSAASSIGAEPYTLAMILEDHRQGPARQDYSILCTDLCTEVLAKTVAGVFPEAMIDPVEPALRRRYLMRAQDASRRQVRIVPELRARIAAARLNLMDERYPVDADMDMVFCRNILIYFDKETQAKVLERLCRHIRSGGYLFLGHSESLVGINLPVRQVGNSVFQKV